MAHSLSEFIYKSDHCKILLFTLQQGDEIKEHRAPVDVLITVCVGAMEIEHDGKTAMLKAGEYIAFKANEKHAVKAVENLEFCLIKLAPYG